MRAIKRSIADARDMRPTLETIAARRTAGPPLLDEGRVTLEDVSRPRRAEPERVAGDDVADERTAEERAAEEREAIEMLAVARSLSPVRPPSAAASPMPAGPMPTPVLPIETAELGTCEHVQREHATRIVVDIDRRRDDHRGGERRDARRSNAVDAVRAIHVEHRDEDRHGDGRDPRGDRGATLRDAQLRRCEPCPRVVPARGLFDGSAIQHIQCDGSCVRFDRVAREQAERVARHRQQLRAYHRAAVRDMRIQLVVTALLAVLAALWVLLAAREARADRHDDRDDDEIDIALPPMVEDPFAPAVTSPAVADVLAAAYRTAGLDRELGRGFVRRSRLAGLVPWLSVRTGRDTSWRDDEPDVSRGVTIEVRATWRLDRLVFDGRELQVAALDAARRRERRRLATRVIQLYFAWKRAARSASQPRMASLAEQAAAELDDLTDGWFSQARRTASETRTVRP